MKWASLADFLAMGGYGLYVWGSYGVTVLLIAIELALALARYRAARRAIEQSRPGPDAR